MSKYLFDNLPNKSYNFPRVYACWNPRNLRELVQPEHKPPTKVYS